MFALLVESFFNFYSTSERASALLSFDAIYLCTDAVGAIVRD